MVQMRSCLLILTLFLSYSSFLKAEEDYDDIEILCDDISCEDYECPDIEDCEYGEVPDVCKCCYACAKGPGDQCGGMFDLAGICTEGYFCKPHPKYSQMPGVCVKDRSHVKK